MFAFPESLDFLWDLNAELICRPHIWLTTDLVEPGGCSIPLRGESARQLVEFLQARKLGPWEASNMRGIKPVVLLHGNSALFVQLRTCQFGQPSVVSPQLLSAFVPIGSVHLPIGEQS